MLRTAADSQDKIANHSHCLSGKCCSKIHLVVDCRETMEFPQDLEQ